MPKGSKNKTKTKKQRRRDEVKAADKAFGEASSRNIIPGAIENERVEEDDNILEEIDRFRTDFLPVGYEDEEDIEEYDGETEKVYDYYDKNVVFVYWLICMMYKS